MEPMSAREAEVITQDLFRVSGELKSQRARLADDDQNMKPGEYNTLVKQIAANARKQDELLAELSDAMTWQNPERLAKK
jgi:hypothetical protein